MKNFIFYTARGGRGGERVVREIVPRILRGFRRVARYLNSTRQRARRNRHTAQEIMQKYGCERARVTSEPVETEDLERKT